MREWIRPIEYNWRGQRLQKAHPGQQVELKPFGPNSPARCTAVINEIDEQKQTVVLYDKRQMLTISWDDWCWMQASPALNW